MIEEATNRVLDSDLNTFKEFKQSQPQGDIQGGLAENAVNANAVNANAVGTGVIGANSKFGRSMERQLNRLADNGVIRFNQRQPQGDILGTQGNAESTNANPMLNNGLGSLGQNNTGGIGLSSGIDNISTTQKSNGLGNIVGYNPQGNNYNIIGGVELV